MYYTFIVFIFNLSGHSDDPHQQKKIQQVIDVTGKPEDEVATALFDAGWDENKAVELLLEDGDHLSAWEETGKKKKTKKAAVEENDDFEGGNDSGPGSGNGGFQDPRDKGSRQRGPPRMQSRGRGSAKNRGDRTGNDGPGGYAENGDLGAGGRGGRGRRRDQPPRRGGRGGGGGRGYSNREQSNGGSGPGGPNSGDVGGFQGSIDTWANPNEQNSGDNKNSRDVRGTTGSGDGGGGGLLNGAGVVVLGGAGATCCLGSSLNLLNDGRLGAVVWSNPKSSSSYSYS